MKIRPQTFSLIQAARRALESGIPDVETAEALTRALQPFEAVASEKQVIQPPVEVCDHVWFGRIGMDWIPRRVCLECWVTEDISLDTFEPVARLRIERRIEALRLGTPCDSKLDANNPNWMYCSVHNCTHRINTLCLVGKGGAPMEGDNQGHVFDRGQHIACLDPVTCECVCYRCKSTHWKVGKPEASNPENH